MRKRFWQMMAVVGLCVPALASANSCAVWPQWQQFKRDFVSADGRVIDVGSPQEHTVSEGQAYAMFFAMVANDKPQFERLLRWTEDNLAQGDLSKHLPAWIWGKNDQGKWGVIDSNPASDADIWIAYALLEAGDLWQERRYTALGQLLLRNILRQETATLPGLGLTLLPAPKGFHPKPEVWRLNPSYVPPQVFRRFVDRFPTQTQWTGLLKSSLRLLHESAPKGFAGEWVQWHAKNGFLIDDESKAEGSYNAIRVYLWLGLMHRDDPSLATLIATYRPMRDYVAQHGAPPERIHIQNLTTNGNLGNASFSASVVPFLFAAKAPELAQQQWQRSQKLETEQRSGYYGQVLTLFAQGWYQGYYRFAVNGRLLPAWRGHPKGNATCFALSE